MSAEGRPCKHEVLTEGCPQCRKFVSNPGYREVCRRRVERQERAARQAAGAKTPPQRTLPVCTHLGGKTGAKVPCGPNRKCSELVRTCAVHGECTMSRPVEGKACCQGCPDFSAPAAAG
jgi:hypothetical protein